MPKKRKSGGRTGSSSGRDGQVQCNKCGRMVPRGKAKRVSSYVNLMDATIRKELQDAGAIMPTRRVTHWYCISCAIHTHKIHIRSGESRHNRDKIR